MKKIKYLFLFIFILILSGCDSKEENINSRINGYTIAGDCNLYPDCFINYRIVTNYIKDDEDLPISIKVGTLSNYSFYDQVLNATANLSIIRKDVDDYDSIIEDTKIDYEFEDFTLDDFYKNNSTGKNAINVFFPNSWFEQNSGVFVFTLSINDVFISDGNEYEKNRYATTCLYYKKEKGIMYFYSTQYNFKNNINQ